MGQAIYKGRTQNHINWVMVDATDFATPESAMSAATKIKVYGQLRSATGTNFVSSGTGSLTNDITHVGASVTGQYQIALANADISDASAAFYDQYIITLSATGAAFQTLIVEGKYDDGSYVSNVLSYLSNMISNASAIRSDIYSALILTQSMASDAASAAQQGASRILLVQSRLSDFDSRLVSDVSDIYSALLLTQSMASDAASAAAQANSRVLVIKSDTSDIKSALAAGVTIGASDMSDLRSAIAAGPAATITASDISDIASAVKAILASDMSDILSAAVQTNSRVLVAKSGVSDIYSMLSDLVSQAATATQVASRVWSNATGLAVSSRVLLNLSRISDVYSAALLIQSMASDAASAAQQGNSRVLVVKSDTSDIKSALAAGVELGASSLSDIRSAITAATFTLSASDISDIASAVKLILASDMSDILSAAQQTNSRVLVIKSAASDIYSLLSDVSSDLGVISGVQSDIYSALTTTRGEPAQGAPAATTDPFTKIDFLYKALRNKTEQTAGKYKLYDDAGVTVDQSAAVSDDGTTFTRAELGTGL